MTSRATPPDWQDGSPHTIAHIEAWARPDGELQRGRARLTCSCGHTSTRRSIRVAGAIGLVREAHSRHVTDALHADVQRMHAAPGR